MRRLRFPTVPAFARGGGGAVCAQARQLRRRLLTIAVAYATTGMVFAAMGGFGVGFLMTGQAEVGRTPSMGARTGPPYSRCSVPVQ